MTTKKNVHLLEQKRSFSINHPIQGFCISPQIIIWMVSRSGNVKTTFFNHIHAFIYLFWPEIALTASITSVILQ